MSLDAFIAKAWEDHADHADDVARRLANSLAMIGKPDDVAPYVRLVTHVYGEHLARWTDGVVLLQSIRALPSANASPGALQAIDRAVATLRYGNGERDALDGLAPDDRIAALATASAAFAGLARHKEALAAYAAAVALAPDDLKADSPAARALAVGGNNLAAALEQKRDRDAAETDGMVAAARAGLKYWRIAGSWLEEERAHYRLARSLLQAGNARAAVDSAARCADVCARNDAPAFEQFFAHAVLAIAQRAAGDRAAYEASRTRARELLELVPADERRWCDSELAELG